MQEFTLKASQIPPYKRFSVFKTHKDDDVNWKEAKMKRDNDFQPWQIKFGAGRTARRFKAIKEGGVGDNASFFIFHKSTDNSDTYEVTPIEDWYAVSATQRYKTLTAEEAEQKFEQRHKMLNLFSVMKSMKGEIGDEGGSSGSRGFKVSELDDWDNSGDEDPSGEENGDRDDDDDDKKSKKSKKKKNSKKPKDEDKEAPEEGKEDSDEGDFEQREVDYMSDTSSDSDDSIDKKDENDVKGVTEEGALRDFLNSEDEDDEANPNTKGPETSKEKAIISDIKQEPVDSDDTSDSEDYDVDDDKVDLIFDEKEIPMPMSRVKAEVKQELDNPPSSSGSGGGTKRKLPPEQSGSQPTISSQSPPKRPCMNDAAAASPFEKMVEDLIVKYLTRKPMTLKSLLKEIKNKLKRIEWVTEEMDRGLVQTIADIIKRLQPEKEKINEVTYLSFRP